MISLSLINTKRKITKSIALVLHFIGLPLVQSHLLFTVLKHGSGSNQGETLERHNNKKIVVKTDLEDENMEQTQPRVEPQEQQEP